MAGRVDGKVALITGAGAGMGAATARLLASEGAKVVAVDWDEEAVSRVVAEITDAGGAAADLVCDVSTPENAERMIAFAVETYGGLDILHNQVFAIHAGLLENLTFEGWNEVLRHTLTATFLGIKYAIPVMRDGGGGSIVNTASISGLTVDLGLAPYGAAKAGVISLTRYAALEYGRDGIRVNAVSPGTVETDAFLQTFGESTTSTSMSMAPSAKEIPDRTPDELAELREGMAEATASGRVTRPEEIAAVVLFLASDESSTVTGANIVADDGVSTHGALPSMLRL